MLKWMPSQQRNTLAVCASTPLRRNHANLCNGVRLASFSTASGRAACNTLIIGGGPVGSSTAYHLSRIRNGDGRGIIVVEKDPTYRASSAMLSAGGIRQQFSLKENVQMSLYGRDFLRSANELLKGASNGTYDDDIDIQFHEHGYLFLASTQSGREQMIKNHKVQCEAGCEDIILLDQEELKTTFPWMHSEDILMGSFGQKGEGWFDPWALIKGLKTKNLDMGVTYIHATPVGAKRNASDGSVLSVDLKHLGQSSSSDNKFVNYSVENVVNAAGAHCGDVMDVLAGTECPLRFPLPVKPRKRCIFFFHCAAEKDVPPVVPPVAPLTIDPSFVYYRSEGSGEASTFICGVSPQKEMDPDIHDTRALDSADYGLFEDTIWPALYHRVPAFGDIKVKSSWAGLYEYNTIDQNAIVDWHPELRNVLMLNGFSGHGLQQSPATGRAAAELLDHGRFQSLDLRIFSFDRCMGEREPVYEMGIV